MVRRKFAFARDVAEYDELVAARARAEFLVGYKQLAAGHVDELDARSSVLEQDGRRIQADDDAVMAAG